MKKAKRNKIIWLSLTLFSLLTGIPMAVFAVLLAFKLKYVLMSFCIAFALHGIWGAGFYYMAYSKTRTAIRLIDGIEQGKMGPEELSDYTGIRADAIERLVEKARKKGYID